MKILEVNKFNHLKGGADRYFLDLCEALKKEGHAVAKFCMDHPDNQPSEWSQYFVSHISFEKIAWKNFLLGPLRMLYSFEAKRKFKRLLADFKPEVIHIHNIYHQLSPSFLPLAKKYKIPVIMHLHDYKFFCPNYKMYNRKGICEKCRGGKYYNCAIHRCLKGSFFMSLLAAIEMYFHHRILKIYEKNIDLYLAPSEFMKAKAMEWGVDRKKIVVFPYFLGKGFISQKTEDEEAEREDYLLYYGRLAKEKGIITLINAFSKLAEKKEKLKLWIVGNGEELENITLEIKKLKLEGKVTIRKAAAAEELIAIIKKAVLVIVPSEWHEVFGLVNAEAGALGRAVIASDAGGIKEVIVNNKTGLLFKAGSVFDLSEKIDYLLSNPEKRLEYGRNAKERCRDLYGEEKHLKELIKILMKF